MKVQTEFLWQQAERYYLALLKKEREDKEKLQQIIKSLETKIFWLEKSINENETKEDLVVLEVSRMLDEWLNSSYIGDEATDRLNFTKRVVGYMRSTNSEKT